MSNSAKRQLSSTNLNWRLPEIQSSINSYPKFIASAIAAFVATAIGLMLSFIVIMAIWLFAAHGNESTIQVVRACAIAWQATNLVTVSIGTTPISLLPWGFVFIPAVVIWKTMFWAVKSSQPQTGLQFWLTALFYSVTYGALSGLISLVSSTDGLSTDYFQAAGFSAVLALIVCSAVVLNCAPSPNLLFAKLPNDFVTGLKPGLVAFLVFWLLSSLLTASTLIFRWNEIKTVSGLMAPNSLDQIFLTLLSISYLPTLITWTSSYILGASIYLGGDALVNTTVVTPGALPAFPLLSILPSEVMPWAKYLIAVPIIVGCLLYFFIPRENWKAQGDSLPIALSRTIRIREFIRISAALLVISSLTWLFADFSSGSLGISYLAYFGPNPTEVALQSVKIFGLAALVTLLLPRMILSVLFWWTNRPKSPKSTP